MAIQVGELLIKMSADLAQLRTDVGSAKTAVGSAMSDIQRSVSLARTALEAFGLIKVGEFLVNMVHGAIEAEAHLMDLAHTTGESVENLSALVAIGKLANVTADEIAVSMNKLARNLTNVDEEGKGAAQALKALGLNLADFKQQSPAEQMLTLANSFDKFRDSEEKSQIAMLLWGRNGAANLPIMKELAGTTELLAKTTTEAAAQAKEFEDNLIRIKIVGEDARRTLANDLLPSLVNITNQLLDGRKAFGSWLEAALAIGFNVNPFSDLGENIHKTRVEIEATRKTLKELQELKDMKSPFGTLASGGASDKIDLAQAKLDKLTKTLLYLQLQQKRALGEDTGPKFDAGEGLPTLKVPEVAHKATEIEKLISKVKEQLAVEQLQAQSTDKLSEAQKQALEIMVRLRDRTIESTVANRRELAALLEKRLVLEKQNSLDEADRKQSEDDQRAREALLESIYKQTAAVEESIAGQERANEEVGLSRDELERLTEQRMLDSAAALRQRAVAMDSIPGYEMLAQLWRDQAAALEHLAITRATGVAKQKAIDRDAFSGAKLGLDNYLEDIRNVNRAAEQVTVDTFRGMEDALTEFFATGHLNAQRFISQLIAEFARLAIVRPLMASLLGSSFGQSVIGGIGSLVTGGFDAFGSGGGGVSGPGMSAPAGFILGASSPAARETATGLQVNVSNVVNGSNLSSGQLASLLQQNSDRTIAKIADLQRRGVSSL